MAVLIAEGFLCHILLEGGGQEGGLRSGTLNVPGIVGLARALELCREEMPVEAARLRELRNRLVNGLAERLEGVSLNGPALEPPGHRLPGNLNVRVEGIEGEAMILMLDMEGICVSSGSACTTGSRPLLSSSVASTGAIDSYTRPLVDSQCVHLMRTMCHCVLHSEQCR